MNNNPEHLSDADLEDVAGGAGKTAPGKKDPAGKTPTTGSDSPKPTGTKPNPNQGNTGFPGQQGNHIG